MSTEKLSLLGVAKGLTALAAVVVVAVAVAEWGESPVEEGDISPAGLVGDRWASTSRLESFLAPLTFTARP